MVRRGPLEVRVSFNGLQLTLTRGALISFYRLLYRRELFYSYTLLQYGYIPRIFPYTYKLSGALSVFSMRLEQ